MSKQRTARLLHQISPSPSSSSSTLLPREVVVVSAVRTPIGRARKGAFKDTHPTTLLSTAVSGALSASTLPPSAVEDVVVGNVLAPGGFATQARMALFLAGLPETVPVCTTNRQCASGLQAVAAVSAAISSGLYDVGVAAGVESMSSADMMASLGPVSDAVFDHPKAASCLTTMGMTSENVAERYGVSRDRMDAFAVQSHARALAAQAAGAFDAEIVPVTTTAEVDGEEVEVVVAKDDGPRACDAATLGKLRPAFKKGGTTSAGNSSQVSDGAAAVVLAAREYAEAHALPVLGVFVAYAVVGVDPEVMGIGPALAIPAVLEKAGLGLEEIDVFELNEAFASQATYCIDVLGIDEDKVNPLGGAIALGHPLGCTGSRQVATLLHYLRATGGKYGIVTMCIGTGMGAAAIFRAQ